MIINTEEIFYTYPVRPGHIKSQRCSSSNSTSSEKPTNINQLGHAVELEQAKASVSSETAPTPLETKKAAARSATRTNEFFSEEFKAHVSVQISSVPSFDLKVFAEKLAFRKKKINEIVVIAAAKKIVPSRLLLDEWLVRHLHIDDLREMIRALEEMEQHDVLALFQERCEECNISYYGLQ